MKNEELAELIADLQDRIRTLELLLAFYFGVTVFGGGAIGAKVFGIM